MVQNAAQRLKENYTLLGDLTDAEFIAAKSAACAKRVIHAERISDIRLMVLGQEKPITVDQIKLGNTIKLKATVRNMLGGQEKTGAVVLSNVRDIQFDEKIGMLTIEADKYILTTMECQIEMHLLNEVIRRDNWVNNQSLSMLIDESTLLSDFKHERDKEIGIEIEEELDLQDIVTPEIPDLLF